MVIKHYRLHTGTWAWILHRVTGVGLALYLLLHIWVTHSVAKGPAVFNATMKIMGHPVFKLAEVALLGAVLYHALNGLRVVMVDLGWCVTKAAHKRVFWAFNAIGAVVLAYGAYRFLGG